MKAKHQKGGFWVRKGVFDGLSSFLEFESRVTQLAEEKDRGDVFEIFIEGYLATQSVAQCKKHWVVGAIPLALREQFNLPNDGTGIDGIYEATDGTYVAYQVKYRQKPNLTYQEVAPFLGITEGFKDRVIFTNASTLAHQATPRTRWFSRQDFLSLTPEALSDIAAWIHGQPVVRKRAEPDPRYQTHALADIAAALKENPRATVVMACGTGKTLVALWAVEQAQPSTVLVLLPSLSLVQQTLQEWARHNNWEERFSFICVCSDHTVVEGDDQPELDVKDLGFRVDTDPQVVRAFLGSASNTVRVVFSTYQSSDVVARGAEGLPAFDIGIFDEAHKTTGLAGNQFSRALLNQHILIRKRLFFTATPRHIDIRGKRNQEGEYKVQSMDDPAVYGPRAYVLSFKAAVEKDVICPYKVVISVVDKALVDDFARKNGITLVEGDEVGVKWVSNLVALKYAIEKTGVTKVVTFHSRVALASEFASDSPRGIGRHLTDFDVRHVNGKQRSVDRAALIRSFAEAPQSLITNARCLTEGVDIPAVDMVAFIDPRQSRVDIAQAVGRAMRKPRGSSKKTVGYVFVPLFVGNDGESVEDAIQSERFDAVADVLNALQEHDEELVDLIREAQQARGQGQPFRPRLLDQKVMLIGPRIEFERIVESVETKLMDRLGVRWDEWFGLLLKWRQTHGNSVPGVEAEFEGAKLGVWIATQRAKQQRGVLEPERRAKLESLPGWFWDYEKWLWERGLQASRDFSMTQGHLTVPRGYVHHTGVKLDHWIRSVKQRYMKNTLSQQEIDDVSSLKGWHWEKFEEIWWVNYEKLKRAVEAGHDLQTLERDRGEGSLGGWVNLQRARYASMKGEVQTQRKPLTAEQIHVLTSLSNWSWDRSRDSWLAHFNAVVEYKLQHNGELPPSTDKKLEVRGLRIVSWISKQRSRLDIRAQWQMDLLRQHLPEILENPYEVKWREAFEKLKDYIELTGRSYVPQDVVYEDFALGAWVTKQRSRRRMGNLSDEQVKLLDGIAGWLWDASSISASGLSRQRLNPKKYRG